MKGSSKRKNAQSPKKVQDEAFERMREALDRVNKRYGSVVRETIEVEWECGCEICAESKRLDLEEITVFEVWTEDESFVTDKAMVACGIASYLKRPVRIVSKRLPRVQYEAIQRSAQ